MLTLRRMPIEAEFVKWMVLLMLALAAALFFATGIVAAAGTPGLLPDDMYQAAKPMPETTVAPYFPEAGPPLQTKEPNQVLWRILELHRTGQVEEAIDAWRHADTACETEVWRHVAVAVANLQIGRIEEAEEQLDAALAIDPRNAAVHYYVGLLRLAQADGARNWMDGIALPSVICLALPQVAPNTRGMYETMAAQELERAIELAPTLDLDAPLAPYAWATDDVHYLPLVTPRVGDLLDALGADHIAARAHQVLGAICTDHGLLDEAEAHLDRAADEGIVGRFAYRDLGRALESSERYADAVRVYAKAIHTGDANIVPAMKMLINGWSAAVGK